ncbi:MAG: hypothetical protein WCD18_17790 [Thermosynechococcaceae cyanobacterium]
MFATLFQNLSGHLVALSEWIADATAMGRTTAIYLSAFRNAFNRFVAPRMASATQSVGRSVWQSSQNALDWAMGLAGIDRNPLQAAKRAALGLRVECDRGYVSQAFFEQHFPKGLELAAASAFWSISSLACLPIPISR